jgi:uncharacterized protein YjdB
MKRFFKRELVILFSLLMISGLVPVGVLAATASPGVSYQTQIENIGWEVDAGIGLRSNGEASGTFGQGLRLEGIKINLDQQGYDLGVSYQTHIQNIGWEANNEIGWKSNGETSGTEGQALRLEAIQIKLTGADANQFDIYYQVHAQNIGWMGWAKNGESAGTARYGYRLEAIKIVVVPKDQGPPTVTTTPAFITYPGVSYQTQIENIGWEVAAGIGVRSNGEASGTSGQSLRLEGIKITPDTQGFNFGISYQTHIQDIGWEADTGRGWKSDGDMSGTQGESKRLEAIQIKLTGADAEQFDIYYQVHAQNFGWMGWAKNGESAGTAGYGYRLEAIRMMLVPKGQGAPSASVVPAFSDKKNSTVEGNLFIKSTAVDFDAAEASFDNVEVSNNGDGAIVLKSGVQSGVYTANSLSTSPFNKLVLSWNSDTPVGTTIQVQARVSLNSNGQWSDWLTWGTWGTSIQSRSGTGLTDDAVAKVDVDTLVVKNGQTAGKIQYRVILNSDQSGVTPTLRLVSGALRNTSQGINKVFTDNPDLSNLPVLDVPRLSQMIRDPAIADSICSPTSMAMVLNYYGTAIQPEQVAWGVYDYNYEDFGNWPFNTAYGGSLGYRAYVDYSTVDGLKREIANGHPAIAAVAYKNSANIGGNLPVIDGAPIASTNGHLIVVCGFTNENGTDYIIINDPAAASNAGVRVKYRLDQFQNAWAESGNITYIIHQNEN